MYQTGCNAYRQSAGNTIEDNRVVLLKLYNGTLKFIANAKRGLIENSPKIRGENISKVMAIITELDCALDMDKGGALSLQLRGLYRYVMAQLTSGNIHNDLKSLDRAETILLTLKEGFEAALQQQKNTISASVQTPGLEMHRPMERVSCAI
ncbi:MAG: flagellar export chaperone FliS [Desulfobacterales bacterium]|jgi:flagellar protein FliS|nr:flagellar export chaperone FliS [Desulfobacterales bacterium]